MELFAKIKRIFKNNRLATAALGLFLLFAASFSFASIALAYNIVILMSKNAAPYSSFVTEFTKVLPESSIKVLDMDGDVDKGSALINKVTKEKTDLIVALGSRAAWVAKDEQRIPVIFSMVSDPDKYNLTGRTGIRIEFSLQQQMQTFKELMPDLKKIGLLYSAAHKEEIKEIKKLATKVGIDVVAIEVNDVKDVASAVDELLMHVNALWLRKDDVITDNARLLKQVILIRALRKKIPIIGDNKWAVQNGALFCLFTSYQGIGAQAGELVKRVISEGELGFQYPLNISVLINSNVAERLSPGVNIVVPKDAFFVK